MEEKHDATQQERKQVVPGLRQYDLTRVTRMILDVQGHMGFMIAWQRTEYPHPLGFCYLVSLYPELVAVYAFAGGKDSPLTFNSICCPDRDGAHAFVAKYLSEAAAAVGVEYAALVHWLGESTSIWRFQGIVDNQLDARHPDNGSAWRSLWGRLVETQAKAVDGVPVKLRSTVRRKLVSFGTEGQIVLDR